MEVGSCMVTTDAAGRELTQHGTAQFPVGCYHDDLAADWVPWHWHEEWEAVVVSQGAAVVAAGEEKQTLQAGQACFVNSGVLHAVWGAEGTRCRLHSLVFHPRLVGGGLDSVFWQEYVAPLRASPAQRCIWLRGETPQQRDAAAAIEAAWQACSSAQPGYVFTVREQLSRLVFLLLSDAPAPHKRPAEKALRDGERIKAMLQYIEAHYAEPLSAAQIAQSALVSESECLRCFRHTIGMPPLQYVRQLRLETAARLLRTGDGRVGDIAARCGFGDASYFTKTFRAWKGCTPGDYRRIKTQE